MDWHSLRTEQVIEALQSSAAGLSATEAQKRLLTWGPNELSTGKKQHPFMMFLLQFTDFMILVLIAAAIIAGFLGEAIDAIAIIVIVLLNAIVGFIQEYRAEKAMEALKQMAAPSASVVREGSARAIPACTLVPGDLVLLEAGAVVPADMRIIEAALLKVEEAALTGESVPVDKETAPLTEPGLTLGDLRNMAFKGTTVTYGRAKGIVTGTGMHTELGKIATMLQEEKEEKTPLQKRLASFGKKLAIAVLVICAVIFAFGLLRGEQPLLMFLTAVSLAVAAIPEALPAVITISLSLGASRMVKSKALIRKLPAVETLGSVTYICSDKTGTLTLNRMTVEHCYSDGGWSEPASANEKLLLAMAISNDSRLSPEGDILGEPTENALCLAALKGGFDKRELRQTYPRVAEIPFDSARKCMTTFHSTPEGKVISFTKGAIDSILANAGSTSKSGTDELNRANERMASQGMRVLCLAYREWDQLPEAVSAETVETGLTIAGLVAMVDPPREEVKAAVAEAIGAGIVPVMITGDHPLTARAIALRLGILKEGGEAVMTGAMLANLSDEALLQKVERLRVYARVAPEQKLRIVKALQQRGHFAAMTGDGVNDAPALKKADIGIAMGITGTDVTKEASDLILLDDNFATIIRAIREGRVIYDNIRKFIRYLLTTNSGEIWTLFLAPFLGLPIPLLPIHILWVNLVTDSLPALALSMEPAEGDVMRRRPRAPQESIFSGGLGIHAVWVGLLMGAVVLGTQAWAIRTGHAHWQTMVFTVICLTQLGHVMAIRSEKLSLFRMGLFSNLYLLGAVLFVFAAQMATVYVPELNRIFKTEPLTLPELLLTLGLSAVIFIAVEIEKGFKRRRAQHP
ncbi:cation-translocating P-type ATPase [Holophaga foetida]|uniref:cation-translocating P-type ATPase n=1 Tax=Holophaga foetida TaxID=35839 RepID=UPI0002472F07|nr:cation-translocating P-type ATPase [Holophaga foetida]